MAHKSLRENVNDMSNMSLEISKMQDRLNDIGVCYGAREQDLYIYTRSLRNMQENLIELLNTVTYSMGANEVVLRDLQRRMNRLGEQDEGALPVKHVKFNLLHLAEDEGETDDTAEQDDAEAVKCEGEEGK